MMMKINLFIECLVFLFVSTSLSDGKISDLRMCADEKCSIALSEAIATVSYASPSEGLLAFRKNTKMIVYSKSAGTNPKVWGVEIEGKRGYIPSNLIRERQLLHPTNDIRYLVPTDLNSGPASHVTQIDVEDEVQEGVDDTSVPERIIKVEKKNKPENKPKQYDEEYQNSKKEKEVKTEYQKHSEYTGENRTTEEKKSETSNHDKIKPDKEREGNLNTIENVPEKNEKDKTEELLVDASVQEHVKNKANLDVKKPDSDKDSTIPKTDVQAGKTDEIKQSDTELNQKNINLEKNPYIDPEKNNTIVDRTIQRKPELKRQDNVKEEETVSEAKLPSNLDVVPEVKTNENEMNYTNMKPVDEPTVIKKEAYQTTQLEDKHTNAHVSENTETKNETSTQGNVETESAESPIVAEIIAGALKSLAPLKSDVNDKQEGIFNTVDPEAKDKEINSSNNNLVVPDIKEIEQQTSNQTEVKQEENINTSTNQSNENSIVNTEVLETDKDKNKTAIPNTLENSINESIVNNSSNTQIAEAEIENVKPTIQLKIGEMSTPPIGNVLANNNTPPLHNILGLPSFTTMIPPAQANVINENYIETNNTDTLDSITLNNQSLPVQEHNINDVNSVKTDTILKAEEGDPVQKHNTETSSNNNVEKPPVEVDNFTTHQNDIQNNDLTSDLTLNNTETDNPTVKPEENIDITIPADRLLVPTTDRTVPVLDSTVEFSPPQIPEEINNNFDPSPIQTNDHTHTSINIPENQDASNITETIPNLYDGIKNVLNLPTTQVPSSDPVSTENKETVEVNVELPPPALENPAIVLADKSDKGFFGNLIETVSSWINYGNTDTEDMPSNSEEFEKQIHNILFPGGVKSDDSVDNDYCEKLTPNSCPSTKSESNAIKHPMVTNRNNPDSHNSAIPKMEQYLENRKYENIVENVIEELIGISDLIMYMVITATTILLFTLGQHCISNNRKESSLLSKLNIIERKLMTSCKECELLKCDLLDTRGKLASIEDNSFGSNEMVIALKHELDSSEQSRLELMEHVASLEKELENAAEAGLELNKMVSELLSNQSGSDSIISSVEELQQQLNEQQATSASINALLAEKSKENSELQVILSDKTNDFEMKIESLQNFNQQLEEKKAELVAQLEEKSTAMRAELNKQLNVKTAELSKFSKELADYKAKSNDTRLSYQTSQSRVHVLEELVKKLKKGKTEEISELMAATNMKTEVLALTKEKDLLNDRLEGEADARKLLEDHVKVVSEEVASLRQEYNLAEKDKLEAQTRLEVLSAYFKDKEMQLQKELSVKEALSMKQQGETTSTVEKIRTMQSEIQDLKSQNDSLKAEIEAQTAAHKAQIGAAENRAHESWLNLRQTERRCEEARLEASALRRKLTSIAGNGSIIENNLQNRHNSIDGLTNDINAPSPIHVDTTGSSLMMGVLPPPPFLPPPFMAPPHAFIPPPPFMPPGEMRPPPLGRLMSPPPPNRYSPSIDRYDRGRYTPDRYNNYSDIMSPYETETDFSPPPSPEPRSGYRDRGYKHYSPSPPPDSRSKKSSKGGISSGSIDSMGSRKSHGGKV